MAKLVRSAVLAADVQRPIDSDSACSQRVHRLPAMLSVRLPESHRGSSQSVTCVASKPK